MKTPLEIPSLACKSNVILFGTNDQAGNWGAGVNVDGKLALNPDVFFGAVAEKLKKGDADIFLGGAYAGLELNGTILKLGCFGEDAEKDKTIYNGVFFQELGSNHIFGVGGKYDTQENARLNFVLGNWPKEKGKGPGYRVLGDTRLEGDFNLGLMFALGANFDKWTHMGPLNITGLSFNDVKIVSNIMDWVVPPTPLHEYTDVAALEIKTTHQDHETDLLVDTAIYAEPHMGSPDNSWTFLQSRGSIQPERSTSQSNMQDPCSILRLLERTWAQVPEAWPYRYQDGYHKAHRDMSYPNAARRLR